MRTKRNGTDTEIGFISHKAYRNIELPVMLEINNDTLGKTQKPKLTSDGKLMFATPGGGYVS